MLKIKIVITARAGSQFLMHKFAQCISILYSAIKIIVLHSVLKVKVKKKHF